MIVVAPLISDITVAKIEIPVCFDSKRREESGIDDHPIPIKYIRSYWRV
jgi:hypothetical protein